jgi:hypothetical protein
MSEEDRKRVGDRFKKIRGQGKRPDQSPQKSKIAYGGVDKVGGDSGEAFKNLGDHRGSTGNPGAA